MIKCVAIDDEPIALSIIRQYCERRGNISIETFSSPRMGMEHIRKTIPDIVFLDIEMNGISGLEMAKELPQECCLIFTTAYSQYAIEGFELNAVDFLHKPYFYERFDRAMQKAETWLQVHDILNASKSSARKLILKSGYKNVVVPIDSILYIESIDNYVRIHNVDGTSTLSKIPLRNIEELLPEGEFIRIHRSYIVAKTRIAKFTKTKVILTKAQQSLPVGKTFSEKISNEI